MLRPFILYMSITIGLVALINAYVADHSVYRGKIKKIDRNFDALNATIASGRPFHMVIGNSYVAASFVTEDPQVLTFTVNGMALSDAVNVIRAIPQEANLLSVTIGVGYNYAMPIGTDLLAYKTQIAQSSFARWWYGIPLIRGRSGLTQLLRVDFNRLGQNLPDDEAEFLDAPTTTDATTLTPEEMQASVVSRYQSYVPFLSDVSPTLTTLLNSANTALDERKRHTPLNAYTAPIFKDLKTRLDPAILTEFHKSVAANTDAYIDLNEMFSDWDETYFSDATHVTPSAGRRYITPVILNLLRADDATEDRRAVLQRAVLKGQNQ